MITIEECKHIEELSKLEFSEDERSKFLEDFSSIVDFASTISNQTSNLNDRKFNTIKLDDLREDVAKDSFDQEEVVSNAPMKKKGCFAVPKIMD